LKVIAAEFVTSAAAGGNVEGIPRDGLLQVAVAGRSNVGKSTLLNALCRRKIARTSAAPGKTRLANVFRITIEGGGPGRRSLYLVDLPGYGYARGGGDAAAELAMVSEAYFAAARTRSGPGPVDNAGQEFSPVDDPVAAEEGISPAGGRPAWRGTNDGPFALLLVDSRHPGLESDIQAARWFSSMQVDHRIVATKIDKLSRSERARNLKALEHSLGMPPLPVSAANGEGLDALWKMIVSLARTGHA
jgi:GTP-binding protein